MILVNIFTGRDVLRSICWYLRLTFYSPTSEWKISLCLLIILSVNSTWLIPHVFQGLFINIHCTCLKRTHWNGQIAFSLVFGQNKVLWVSPNRWWLPFMVDKLLPHCDFIFERLCCQQTIAEIAHQWNLIYTLVLCIILLDLLGAESLLRRAYLQRSSASNGAL